MSILLLSLVVVGIIFLIGYFIWMRLPDKKPDSELSDYIIEGENKNKIVETVYKEASKKKKKPIGSHTFKINILNNLNISPHVLRDCIKQLIKEELIIETDESIALTSFGVQYYEIFIRRIMAKRKAKK